MTLDPVEFEFNFPAELRQLTRVVATYETGVFTGSGSGTVQGQVIPVDINLTGDRASSSGCEAEDFAGLDVSGPSDIALIQRGTCNFGDKAQNAENAGAEAVIIFNQGNTPEREALFVGDASALTDGTPVSHDIPVVGASFAAGVALAAPGSTAFVEVVPPEIRTDYNVIAELPGKDEDNVVIAGAHLDSVIDGPGINDNGSGSAALLETALMMAKLKPENTHRAVHELRHGRLAQLHLHGVRRGSVHLPGSGGVPIPEGSTAIEDLYESYYTLIGEPYDDTQFSGRSDYQAFIENGIPSGGLFTGAEGIKTEEQEAIWGGTAGEQFDPCYHQACDTFDNVDLHALEVNSDLIAFAMLTFATRPSRSTAFRARESRVRPSTCPHRQVPRAPSPPLTAEAGPVRSRRSARHLLAVTGRSSCRSRHGRKCRTRPRGGGGRPERVLGGRARPA